MSYNSKIFNIASQKLQEIRDRNRDIHEMRKKEISEKIPEYVALRNQLLNLVGENIKNTVNNNESNIDFLKKQISDNEKKRKKLLLDNGFSDDYLDSIYNCPHCKDTGYVQGKRCECFDKILREIATKESNLSYVLDEQNFSNFDLKIFSGKKTENGISPKENMKNIVSHIKVFIDNFDDRNTKSLLFTGNTGVGKTFLSSCIAKTLIDNGKNVLYQSSGKLTEILEEYKFNRDNAVYDTKSIVKDLYDIDLLIIDDFGTEFKTSYTLTALYELINSRIINCKKMIISTNLTLSDLNDVYSERLLSRFLGDFQILEFIGEDLRAKKILNK